MIKRIYSSAAGIRSVRDKKTLNLASLYEISRVIGATLNFDKLLNVILTTMIKQTSADSGSLMLFDEERKELYIAAYRGISDKIAKKIRIKTGQGIAGIVAQQKQPLLINNKTFFSISGKKPHRKIKSSLSIPLSFSDKLIGVINLNRVAFPEEFTDEDLKAISIFATESSIAIHNAKLYIAAEEKIQQLFRFNVINCALNSAFTQEKIISVLGECMRELFALDIYTFLLVEQKQHYLLIVSKKFLHKKTVAYLKKNLSLVIAGIKEKKLEAKKLLLSIKKPDNSRWQGEKIYPRHIQSVLNAPLIAKGKILGMLSIYSTVKNSFTQKEQQTLNTLANQTAVALENANLYKNLHNTYISTIKALAQAIEEKDPYTRGHSELVSHYSVAIAKALKLPGNVIEGIQIAGILHDIGKIGIPEKILSKPGCLTDKEYKIIKNHPLIGKRILAPVNFFWGETESENIQKNTNKIPKKINKKILLPLKAQINLTMDILKTTDISEEIKDMIYHHHERFGGNGYPDGLKGEKIPLGSRILAVADTFEAMTAVRPYRAAFPVKKALTLIKSFAPEQLDPKIVDIFLELVKNKYVCIKKNQKF